LRIGPAALCAKAKGGCNSAATAIQAEQRLRMAFMAVLDPRSSVPFGRFGIHSE
jgi:hypothetical protein